jgi:polysaccharide export outer membrane protein
LQPSLVYLTGTALSACAYLPNAGPTAGEVVEQGIQDNQIRYAVVDVNANVVSVVLARPAESFDRRFGKYGRSPAPKIGVGDTVTVTIWEAAGGGLFGTSATIGVSPGARSAPA